MIVLRIL